MKILIIGLGSIARKHIAAINEIDKNAVIYALRSNKSANNTEGVVNIYSYDDIEGKLDFCIISNPTNKHYETIEETLKLNIPLFIEKPSLMRLRDSNLLLKKINRQEILTYVAFNLRFHPVIKFLKEYLRNKRVIEVNVYCGSYLPNWRPNIDYKKNYSAIAEMGGGVHLDLIHEIDYSLYLFGKPLKTKSTKKKISDLKINSFDIATYNLLYKSKIVNIILNYYRKQPKREIEIVTDTEIIKADLLKSKVVNEYEETIFYQGIDINYTYKEQMKYFYDLITKNRKGSFSNFSSSLETLKICLK